MSMWTEEKLAGKGEGVDCRTLSPLRRLASCCPSSSGAHYYQHKCSSGGISQGIYTYIYRLDHLHVAESYFERTVCGRRLRLLVARDYSTPSDESRRRLIRRARSPTPPHSQCQSECYFCLPGDRRWHECMLWWGIWSRAYLIRAITSRQAALPGRQLFMSLM